MSTKMVIFSGAGISADSGIQTFRDGGGLWEGHSVDQVCNAATWKRNAEAVHAFYNARRIELARVEPNEAHHMVKRLQDRYGATVITQNVDDLFERAGCRDIVHVHGSILDMKCEACGHLWTIGYRAWDHREERCPSCVVSRNGVRPGIVMFGDMAPQYRVMNKHLAELREIGGPLVVIGTSGQVVDIGYFASIHTGPTILSNLESQPHAESVYGLASGGACYDHLFKTVMHGRASEKAREIEQVVIRDMEKG